MKTISAFLILLSSFSFAQTGLIAHKSHSGNAESYAFAAFGNFGNPPPILRLVEKINDTTIVMILDDMGAIYYDTVQNHPLFSNPNLTIDSLKKTYYYGNNVEFKNFEEKAVDDESQNALPVVKEPIPKAAHVEVKSKQQQRKEKRQKKSWVLFLFIGGGTFLGMGLGGRIMKTSTRKLQQIYA